VQAQDCWLTNCTWLFKVAVSRNSYFARSVPVCRGAGLLCLWGQLPGSSVNHIGERTDMIQARTRLASSRPGPLFPSKLTFEKWFYRFWILGNGLSCAYARAQARRRASVRGRACVGERACLRFERVLNLPLGAREGGLKGCLFVGRVTIAE